jgi:hypothetical protein
VRSPHKDNHAHLPRSDFFFKKYDAALAPSAVPVAGAAAAAVVVVAGDAFVDARLSALFWRKRSAAVGVDDGEAADEPPPPEAFVVVVVDADDDDDDVDAVEAAAAAPCSRIRFNSSCFFRNASNNLVGYIRVLYQFRYEYQLKAIQPAIV